MIIIISLRKLVLFFNYLVLKDSFFLFTSEIMSLHVQNILLEMGELIKV